LETERKRTIQSLSNTIRLEVWVKFDALESHSLWERDKDFFVPPFEAVWQDIHDLAARALAMIAEDDRLFDRLVTAFLLDIGYLKACPEGMSAAQESEWQEQNSYRAVISDAIEQIRIEEPETLAEIDIDLDHIDSATWEAVERAVANSISIQRKQLTG